MGLYDTVYFRCPKCEGLLYEQSKAGECSLKDFDCDSVPVNIAKSIIGNDLYCDNCNATYEIVSLNNPSNVRLGIVLKN